MADFIPADSSNLEAEMTSASVEEATTPAEEIVPKVGPGYTFLTEKSNSMVGELRALLDAQQNADLSDVDCERFIIARNHKLEKAHAMIVKFHEWHNKPFTDQNIEDKSLRPRDLSEVCADKKEHIMATLLQYSFSGHGKDGNPIYWEKSGQVAANWSRFSREFTSDEIQARHIHMLELMNKRCLKASAATGRLIRKKILVMDLTGLPVFPEWSLYRTMQKFEEMDNQCYPETLKHMILINAPVYFTAIWAVVKPWMDEETLKKVMILGSNFLPTLREIIADDQIPAEYGGSRENVAWTWPECFEQF